MRWCRAAFGFALVVASSLSVVGCQHGPAGPAREAVLVEPDSACRSQVGSAAGALAGGPVLLADDVFTRSSEVSVERRRLRDPATGRVLDGLDTGGPRVLGLVIEDGRCVLVDRLGGKRRELAGCRCRQRAAG